MFLCFLQPFGGHLFGLKLLLVGHGFPNPLAGLRYLMAANQVPFVRLYEVFGIGSSVPVKASELELRDRRFGAAIAAEPDFHRR